MTKDSDSSRSPAPRQIVEWPRHSWQSYVLAGLMRSFVRPVANRWPHSGGSLRLLDRLFDTASRLRPAHWFRSTASARRVTDIGEMHVWVVRAPSVRTAKRTVLHFHGGGFVFGTPRSYYDFALRLSASTSSEVVVFDYGHPPHVSVEAMMADCLAAYRWVLGQRDGRELVLSGDSAGTTLMFGTAVAARDDGLALPTAMVAQSGWLDPGYRHPRSAAADPFFAERFAERSDRLMQTGGELPAAVRPLDADLVGLPPVLLQVSSQESPRDANERMAARLSAAGVPVELQLWDRQVHAFQFFAGVLPEGRAALTEIASFLDRVSEIDSPAHQLG